jgi:TonB family protein
MTVAFVMSSGVETSLNISDGYMKRTLLITFCIVITTLSAPAQSSDAALISAPRPDYPEEASTRHVFGCGLYQIDIDFKTGAVSKVEVLKSAGHPLLNRAAVDGLLRWRAKAGGVRFVKLPVCFEPRAGKPTVTYGTP